MILALLLLLVSAWITWLLFRDDDVVEKLAEPLSSQEPNERGREQRGDE